MGAAICVPNVYTHGDTGPWAFQDECPRLWYLLLTVINKPESNWTLVDLAGYLAAKLKFTTGRR
eukprot:10518721-Karenia_brevis.AAC.1